MVMFFVVETLNLNFGKILKIMSVKMRVKKRSLMWSQLGGGIVAIKNGRADTKITEET